MPISDITPFINFYPQSITQQLPNIIRILRHFAIAFPPKKNPDKETRSHDLLLFRVRAIARLTR
ncbi:MULTISPECIES: hypothetical protein [Spirulina sp. CCY15215]|uniref:hypothetical protein n=1 Tax=Spirulina sp. CCY15215 TaxID=2767591 RepID=UPI00195103EB|nr:hypothetical protein [Spirulina major]